MKFEYEDVGQVDLAGGALPWSVVVAHVFMGLTVVTYIGALVMTVTWWRTPGSSANYGRDFVLPVAINVVVLSLIAVGLFQRRLWAWRATTLLPIVKLGFAVIAFTPMSWDQPPSALAAVLTGDLCLLPAIFLYLRSSRPIFGLECPRCGELASELAFPLRPRCEGCLLTWSPTRGEAAEE